MPLSSTTNEPTTSRSVSMKGGGYYSENTRGAKDVIDGTASLAIAALEDIDLDGADTPVHLADFGAADGGTSIDLMRTLVGEIRGRAPARDVCVTYTDLPNNDFSALFRMLDGQREDITSYQHEHERVFAYASGTSFYKRIFPNATLTLGFSATAMHWLSGVPGPITDHVHAVGAKGEELERFREYAMRDWNTILTHRAHEIAAGGRLVMSNFCIDESGRYLGSTGGVDMFGTFNELWRELADAGHITEVEYRGATFPQFYKTIEEYCDPLRCASSPVYQLGLRLVSAETRVVACPYAAAYERHGDARRFAESYVPTLRSWSESVFFGALDPSRPPAERHGIVDTFYQAYVERVAAAPAGHAMDYVHVYMVAAKE